MKTPKQIRDELKEHDQYLGGMVDQKDLDEFKDRSMRFAIDDNNFNEEVAKLGAVYHYYTATAIAYRTLLAKAQWRADLIASRIKLEMKEKDPRDGRKGGPTADHMNAVIQTDGEWQKANVEVKNIEHALRLLEADIAACEKKSSMLRLRGKEREKEDTMKGRL